ncbi:heat shock factor-binding protein-like [Magnolia sinica]|uniref:heat shock factor-binding protein-like n=1 Tax=Magnolia sinica TaxID=86752 RepID=UPI002658BD54|nr:heat shock factor-binding protein-like [Magnolia sinica]
MIQTVNDFNGQESDNPKQSTADMTDYVQSLLQQMQSKFQAMSDSIVSEINEMGSRIGELVKSINDLKAEMGTEGSPSPMVPSKRSEDGSS